VVVRITTRLNVKTVAIVTFLGLMIVVGHAQAVPPFSEVRAVVFDETGAVIPGCEILFKSESETSVSHTGMDGSVTVKLPSGGYAVTASKAGFVRSKMLNVQIVTPMPDALRIVLKVDHTPTDGPMFDGVPTTTSELPTAIEPQASRVPSVSAREKLYGEGKLVSIESPDTPFPLPLPSGQIIGVRMQLLSRFAIQQADILYLGTCLKRDCKAEWRVGDDVEFRREKDKLYLKRPKHGETELHFLLSAKLDADGKPVAVLDYGAK
jgi:hypothetical protein